MPRITPTQSRNVLLPIRRIGKGWNRGRLVPRYETALRSLFTTPLGFYPWEPDYGTLVYLMRNQGMSADPDGLLMQVKDQGRRAIAQWIPEITLQGMDLQIFQREKSYTLTITWAIPAFIDQVTPDQQRFAVDPIATQIVG